MSRPVWVCYGGGTDSTAMLVEMVRRQERIDLVTFADTGAEMPHTYETVRLMDTWLQSKGYPGITTVFCVDRHGQRVTLEDSIIKNCTVPSLAFGWHTCSIRFKITPQVKLAKKTKVFIDAWARGEKVIRCIGYDAGKADSKRACRPTTQFPDLEEFDNRFPLREWGWDRERCLAEILSEGLPDPGKSACYFCPARKKPELDHMLKHDPVMLARAIAIEAAALSGGKLRTTKGLGRSFSWGDYIRTKETA